MDGGKEEKRQEESGKGGKEGAREGYLIAPRIPPGRVKGRWKREKGRGNREERTAMREERIENH